MTIAKSDKFNFLCKGVTGSVCRAKGKCKFAHTLLQLNPIRCKWDVECVNNALCGYIHKDEDKIMYAKRLNFIDTKKEKNYCFINLQIARKICKKLELAKPISGYNKGRQIMEFWGWKEGQGLGKHGQGILNPVIPVSTKDSFATMKNTGKHDNKPIKFVKGGIIEQTFSDDAIENVFSVLSI